MTCGALISRAESPHQGVIKLVRAMLQYLSFIHRQSSHLYQRRKIINNVLTLPSHVTKECPPIPATFSPLKIVIYLEDVAYYIYLVKHDRFVSVQKVFNVEKTN